MEGKISKKGLQHGGDKIEYPSIKQTSTEDQKAKKEPGGQVQVGTAM